MAPRGRRRWGSAQASQQFHDRSDARLYHVRAMLGRNQVYTSTKYDTEDLANPPWFAKKTGWHAKAACGEPRNRRKFLAGGSRCPDKPHRTMRPRDSLSGDALARGCGIVCGRGWRIRLGLRRA